MSFSYSYTPDMNSDGHDTNASYAGNWLANFYKTTLNNKKLLDKTVILITFDEVNILFTFYFSP
jgi:phospholipase C